MNAGSFQGTQRGGTASAQSFNLSENYWALNLFSYNFEDDGLGCQRIKSHLGWNGFASGNFNYSLCSDGSHFCFVPVQSALDYGVLGTIALDHDIEIENINTKLARIADGVDVMIGYPRNIPFRANNANHPHVNMRNDPILNIDESGFFYHSCGRGSIVERAMLNLEIGDEQLYLENVTLPWRAVYQSEWDVLVNVRNPHYQYPSAGGTLRGIYSKHEPYLVDDSGFATFLWDNGGANAPINGVGFRYEPPFSPNTNNAQQPLFVCCRNFIGQRQVNIPMAFSVTPLLEEKKKQTSQTTFSIFPNPNNGVALNLRYRFQQSGIVTANLRTLTGQLLLTKQFANCAANVDNSAVLNLASLNFARGTYVLQLTNGKELKTSKLILTK